MAAGEVSFTGVKWLVVIVKWVMGGIFIGVGPVSNLLYLGLRMGKINYAASFMLVALLLAVLPVHGQEADYTNTINMLTNSIKNDKKFHHSAYERLAYISDTYGPRMWGSSELEKVIYELHKMAKDEGFQDVHLESVQNFTKWVRGEESLTLFSPRPVATPLKVIGLGGSVAGSVKAEAIVFSSYEEL